MAKQAAPMTKVEVDFVFDRDTKTKMRFTEVEVSEGKAAPTPTPKDRAHVEKLYVSKKTLKNMGNPESVHVTIEAR